MRAYHHPDKHEGINYMSLLSEEQIVKVRAMLLRDLKRIDRKKLTAFGRELLRERIKSLQSNAHVGERRGSSQYSHITQAGVSPGAVRPRGCFQESA